MTTIYLLTLSFPYGKAESFLWAELDVIKRFYNVVLVPQQVVSCQLPKSSYQCEVLSGVTVDMRCAERKNQMAEIFFEFLRFDFYIKLFKEISKIRSVPGVYGLVKFLARSRKIKNELGKLLNDRGVKKNTKVIFYSYWSMESANAISILKETYANFKLIVRCHNVDIYRERRPGGYMPLQKRFLNNFDRVVPISEHAQKYLIEHYNIDKYRIYLGRLGVQDFFCTNYGSNSEKIHIVSCSFLTPVKRIDLLIDGLEKLQDEIDKKIVWTHFGDGPLSAQLKKIANRKLNLVDVFWKGFVSNDEIINFYKNTDVDMLVNVSEIEGIPVSIMEAQSFGLPVVATDVGGVSEIVNKNNGILLEKAFSSHGLVKAINYLDRSNSREKRDAIKLEWKRKYSAEKNFGDFVSECLNAQSIV